MTVGQADNRWLNLSLHDEPVLWCSHKIRYNVRIIKEMRDIDGHLVPLGNKNNIVGDGITVCTQCDGWYFEGQR